MEKARLAAQIDAAINSRKEFIGPTFGEIIVGRLDRLREEDDLMTCGAQVNRRFKWGMGRAYDHMTQMQRRRAWAVLVETGAVILSNDDDVYEYKHTADVWGYEPGLGKANTTRNETLRARNDDEAKAQAEHSIGLSANYRWSAWQQDSTGWERHRTAANFEASWMRIERIG